MDKTRVISRVLKKYQFDCDYWKHWSLYVNEVDNKIPNTEWIKCKTINSTDYFPPDLVQSISPLNNWLEIASF